MLRNGMCFFQPFSAEENPSNTNLNKWLYTELKRLKLKPIDECCDDDPYPEDGFVDTRLTNPHVTGTTLCFDLFNVTDNVTITPDAYCVDLCPVVDACNTASPITIVTSNTTNSTTIDVSTLPNQPVCTGVKTYVLTNDDGTGATILSGTGVITIDTNLFYPFCGEKKLSGHILCNSEIVGHFVLDILYNEKDEYTYDVSCLLRTTQTIESSINSVTVLNSNNCVLPVTAITIANIGTTTLYPAVYAADALASQLNAQEFYNGIPCANYKAIDNNQIVLSVPKGTTPAPGILTTQIFKRYTFNHFYEVTKLGAGVSIHDSYVDENLPLFESPTAINNTFTDLVLPSNRLPNADSNNIHFYDGIYGTINGTTPINLFRNRGLKDMFRYTFSEFKEDGVTDGVGLNGYSNRGFNEIGGAPPLDIAAYNIFKRRLIEHITISAAAQGYCVVCNIADSATTTIDNTANLDRFYTLTIDVPTNMTLTHLSGHNLSSVAGSIGPLNEWGYADNGNPIHKIEDWVKDDIYLTTASHMPTATLVPTAGIATIDPAINGVGGSTNFLNNCRHNLANNGV